MTDDSTRVRVPARLHSRISHIDPAERGQPMRSTDGRFKPGQSGNWRGKAKGTRHHATEAVEALMSGEAEALAGKAVALALNGDTTALKMCLDRLCPPLRTRPARLDLPAAKTGAENITEGLAALLAAAAAGDIDPEQAQTLGALFDIQRRNLETCELEQRLNALEAETNTAPFNTKWPEEDTP
ncbi:MAG: hypothetical protein JNK21_01360 [Rhodospirillaceae bacterium]|nr:hypothetical protein [Rhodospirillaceae bacterium]